MKKNLMLAIFLAVAAFAATAQENPKGGYIKQKGGQYRDGTCKPPTYNLCATNVLYHETHYNFSYLLYNSINYERTLICRPKFMMTLRVGGIYYNFVKLRLAGAPLGLNFLFGGGRWLFDAGLGGTYLYIYKNYSDSLGSYNDQVHCVGINAHVGIRYEIQREFFFKLVFDPMYVVMGKDEIPLMKNAFQPMVGLGLGYTFKK